MPSKREATSEDHSIPLLSQADEEQARSSPDHLYTPSPPPKRPLLNRYSWIVAALLLLLFIGLLAIPKPGGTQNDDDNDWDDLAPVPDSKGLCKQSNFVDLPDDELSKTLERTLKNEEYIQGSADRLSGAVRIATESFDDMGPVGEDPRWDIFQEFHDYLEKTYPLMYSPSPRISFLMLMIDIHN